MRSSSGKVVAFRIVLLSTLGVVDGVLARVCAAAGGTIEACKPAGESVRMGWFFTLLIILAVVAIVAVDAALLLFIARWQKNRYRKHCRIQLHNTGNVRDRYHLVVADDIGGALFRLSVAGVPLGEVTGAPVADVAPVAASASAAATPSPTVKDSAASGLDTARAVTGRAKGLSGLAADALNSIGNMLHGEAGAPFRNMAAQIRSKQAVVRRVEQAPGQTVARAGQAPRRALGSTRGAGRRFLPGRALRRPRSAKLAKGSTGEASAGSTAGAPVLGVAEAGGFTPVLGPSETMTIDLDVALLGRPRETTHLALAVRSKGLAQEQSPWVSDQAMLTVNRVAWFEHEWPLLVFGVGVVLELLLFWAFLSTGVLG